MEPFYKNANEVATISYVREHSSAPVPHIAAHSPTADNELGFEWTLMEKIPDVSLRNVWREMDIETRERETMVVTRYAKRLHDQCPIEAVGNLYFREDLSDPVCTVPITDDKFIIRRTG